ncbi:MAG: aminopeptidase P family protein [Gemmatimonadetes bacterium]|nr:aminopeptidase P family protein [Gemmatimonadota bacterium]
MSVTEHLTPETLVQIRRILPDLRCDGWLLFDFHGLNPVATRVLGLGGLATRRLFVFIPAVGRPTAIAHKIEVHRVDGFPGDVRTYASWRELERELGAVLSGKRIAMEYSAKDAVPYLDRVPAGVVELVRASGAEVVTSSELVTAIAARWSEAELEGHRRAAELIREIALAGFERVRDWFAEGMMPTEQGLQRWVLEAFERSGLHTDAPPIVATGEHSANPHHEPTALSDTAIQPGEVLLLDLWAGVSLEAVYADQTWMAFLGTSPPADVTRVFEVVRDARDRAVALLADKWREGWSVTGAELDDAARKVIANAGFGEYFVHRTGHSIDRELHGSGPHLDNFETHDDRKLLPGVGFSVEPGVYLPGRFGVRSEINVVLHERGPEVTPAEPQRDLICLDVRAG